MQNIILLEVIVERFYNLTFHVNDISVCYKDCIPGISQRIDVEIFNGFSNSYNSVVTLKENIFCDELLISNKITDYSSLLIWLDSHVSLVKKHTSALDLFKSLAKSSVIAKDICKTEIANQLVTILESIKFNITELDFLINENNKIINQMSKYIFVD